MNDIAKKREGDLFEIITVNDINFEIRYGYNADFERDSGEPMPIFPDLKTNPIYTANGEPIITQMQDICNHYERKPKHIDDESCADCVHFYTKDRKLIGICKNEKRRIDIKKGGKQK